MDKRLISLLAGLGSLTCVGAVSAAIPSTAPYYTDPQNEYVQDRTSDGINNLNMVMCIVHGMAPAEMFDQYATLDSTTGVTSVTYRAMVDMNKCDNNSRASTSNSASGSSGSSSAPNYINAAVEVSRTSNSDPMIAKVWMHFSDDFGGGSPAAATVYAHLSATQSPADVPPYGAFRLDYIGKLDADSSVMFNGFIDSGASGLSYLENGFGGSNTGLTLDASSTTAGSGLMRQGTGPGTSVDFAFAYDTAYFLRDKDGGTQYCFDRTKANANKSVWRYGTYDAATGERVDQSHPGFPVTATYGGQTFFGYAGYWGIDFQGLDLNALSDADIAANVVVNDQRPGNSATYTLHRVPGKLTKWTRNSATLADLNGIPFTFGESPANLGVSGADLTTLSAYTSDQTQNGFANWQTQWNGTTFDVVGVQTCGSNGCVTKTLSASVTIPSGTFANRPLMGWSDSYGGNLSIPATTSAHTDGDAIFYYVQSDVIPGSAGGPANLYCLNNCPTQTSMAAFDGTNSPFGNGTDTQWFMGSNTVTYAFGAGGLTESGTAMTDTTTSHFSGQWNFGIQTGRLFLALDTSAADGGTCPPDVSSGMFCEPGNPTTYYTWQTGPQQWTQAVWLTNTSDSSVVSFDPPQNVSYPVPNDSTTYGSWANKTILLQFTGFGNLFGIPGHCVDPSDNSPVSCDTPNVRYVPEFAIPDGATMTLGSTPIIVKALDSELRLKQESPSVCTNDGLSLSGAGSMTLPALSSLHNPTDSTDSTYIGTEPSSGDMISSAPSVVDGVLQ